ncbi:MAG: hypothetical protein DWI57_00745 [Chloroflexi bacterium]|nr:MAG: hypothetical protein DWI57_00745 [Chloroflexota bacterium]
MNTREVTLSLPEFLYLRFQQMATATRQPVDDLLVRAVAIGGPPSWEEAPPRFQADLAALDRMTDDVLWRVARAKHSQDEADRMQDLLGKRSTNSLTDDEKSELKSMLFQADLTMLRKAHAAALLRWRGHIIPPAEKM